MYNSHRCSLDEKTKWSAIGPAPLFAASMWLAACDDNARVEVAPECIPFSEPAMVEVEAGTYTVGNSAAFRDDASLDDLTDAMRPRLIDVRLDYSFAIQNTEVTSSAFLEVMGYDPTPRVTISELLGATTADEVEPFTGAVPAHSVSWFEALAYANALSELERLPPCYDLSMCTGAASQGDLWCDGVPTWSIECEGYRLPTALEWEIAARAGTEWDFAWTPFDDVYYAGQSYAAVVSVILPEGLSGARPFPVGTLCPNSWNIYDMQGNVAEWVIDGPYNASQSLDSAEFMWLGDDDFVTWWPGDSPLRESRGGHISSGLLRAALGVRRPLYPIDLNGFDFYHQGFRLVRFAIGLQNSEETPQLCAVGTLGA